MDLNDCIKMQGIFVQGEIDRESETISFISNFKPKLKGPYGGDIDCILLEDETDSVKE